VKQRRRAPSHNHSKNSNNANAATRNFHQQPLAGKPSARPAAPTLFGAQRPRAHAPAGAPTAAANSSQPRHYAEALSGIRVKLPLVSGVVLREEFARLQYVPLASSW
jgi:hypothetical protein